MLVAIWNLRHSSSGLCLLTWILPTIVGLVTSRVVTDVPQPTSTSVPGLIGGFAHVKTVCRPIK